ncbi:hypothetical protein [Rhizobium leguminosarum]|uniref:hypothetical protein n=1 Tax=Rhizobium leguminosarum TaxID=384 RepID=UPI003F9E1D7B
MKSSDSHSSEFRSRLSPGCSSSVLNSIDDFIPNLPREYRTYAYLIRSIAIDPEYALSLQVKFIEDLWQRHGFVHATLLLSSVPPSEVARYLLVTEIRGRRLQTLRRNRIAPKDQPSQVFLDYKARPITMAMANAAFIRASRRHGAPSSLTPALMREAVLQASYLDLSANSMKVKRDAPFTEEEDAANASRRN